MKMLGLWLRLFWFWFSSLLSQTWATWWSCLCVAALTNMILVNNLNIRNVLAMFVPGLNLFSCVVSSRDLLNGFITSVIRKRVPVLSSQINACWYFKEPKVDWTFQTQWRKRIIYLLLNKEMRKSFIHSWYIFYALNIHSKAVWMYFAT